MYSCGFLEALKLQLVTVEVPGLKNRKKKLFQKVYESGSLLSPVVFDGARLGLGRKFLKGLGSGLGL
jgi:hypothetical protein